MASPTNNDITVNESLTFEKVWASIQETNRQLKESEQKSQEADRRFRESLQESGKEFDRKMQESMRKLRDDLDEEFKRTDRIVGALGNRFGELVEHLVTPSIIEKFNDLGFEFDKCSENIRLKEKGAPRAYAELDLLLENGEVAVAIEIKAKAKQADVDEHLERIEILRRRADRQHDSRKFQGAIAGAIMNDAVRDYAHRKGLYVIVQTGDTVKIDIPEDFKPREW